MSTIEDAISPLVHEKGLIDERELVEVTNRGEDLTIKFEGRSYPLPSGTPVRIPYGAAVLWFGDPRAVDKGHPENWRAKEWMRLRIKWGIGDQEPLEGVYPEMGCFPDVDVRDLSGMKVVTVIDDPQGEVLAGGEEREGLTNEQIQAQLAKLQAELDARSDTRPAPTAAKANGVQRPDGTTSKPRKAAAGKPKRDGEQ